MKLTNLALIISSALSYEINFYIGGKDKAKPYELTADLDIHQCINLPQNWEAISKPQEVKYYLYKAESCGTMPDKVVISEEEVTNNDEGFTSFKIFAVVGVEDIAKYNLMSHYTGYDNNRSAYQEYIDDMDEIFYDSDEFYDNEGR